MKIDQTFIGGKAFNKHGGHSGTMGGTRIKTPIIGAVSRDGNAVTRVIASVNKATAQGFVREVVSHKVS